MFAAESLDPSSRFSPSGYRMVQIDNPLNRRKVKQFIQRCFRDEYDASIDIYAGNLITLLDHNQQIKAGRGLPVRCQRGAVSGVAFRPARSLVIP